MAVNLGAGLYCVCRTPNDGQFLTGGGGGSSKTGIANIIGKIVLNRERNARLAHAFTDLDDSVHSMVLHPNNKTLFASLGEKVIVMELSDNKDTPLKRTNEQLDVKEKVARVAISPKGTVLAVGCSSGKLKLYKYPSLELFAEIDDEAKKDAAKPGLSVKSIAFHPTANIIACARERKELVLYRVRPNVAQPLGVVNAAEQTTATVNPNEGSDKQQQQQKKQGKGKKDSKKSDDFAKTVTVAKSENEEESKPKSATNEDENAVISRVQRITHDAAIRGCHFSPDGEFLYTVHVSDQRTTGVLCWEAKESLSTTKDPFAIVRARNRVTGLIATCSALSSCGKYIGLGTSEGRVFILQSASLQTMSSSMAHVWIVTDLIIAPIKTPTDSEPVDVFLSSCADGTISSGEVSDLALVSSRRLMKSIALAVLVLCIYFVMKMYGNFTFLG
jgi:WD40 repeat protein